MGQLLGFRISFYYLFIAVIVGILIYLIFSRIENKKKETFEKRDN